MHYRRAKINGATYFFTVVTHDRKPFLCHPENVKLLRQALRSTMERHPIEIDAFVLLPDHLHTIWTLPDDDHDFSTRWRQIKSYFTRNCQTTFERATSTSRKTNQERAFWQRRFWEHTVKDTQDYINHVEYIHYNPVKHGLVYRPKGLGTFQLPLRPSRQTRIEEHSRLHSLEIAPHQRPTSANE